MRITESRLRRIIRSVINETNKYEREVNNRKWKEYKNTPSQEQMQARDDERKLRDDIDRCANQLAKLYRSLIQKERKEFSRDSKRLYIRIVLAAGGSHLFYQNKPTEQEIEEARKELLKVSNMSSFEYLYLESDSFWEGVQSFFEINTMLDTMSEKELRQFFN